MGDTDDSTIFAPHHKKRLAILDVSSDVKKCIGIVMLSADDTDTDTSSINVSLHATRQDGLEEAAPLIDFDELNKKSDGKRTVEDLAAEISSMLESKGLRVKELPLSDFQVEMVVDTRSGRTVSRQTALHPYASEQEDIARDIHKAITDTFAAIPLEIAQDIRAATESGENGRAVEIVEEAAKRGALGVAPNLELLEALISINLDSIGPSKKELIRKLILWAAHHLGRINIASEQAESLLKEIANPSDTQKAELEMVISHGAIERGEVETAISIWRRLLKEPCILDPASRGWAWRNLALALGSQNLEAMETGARNSTDAFLEAGDKENAGRSMAVLVDALSHRSPEDAIEALNKIETLFEQEGISNIRMLASFYHMRGMRLSELGDHANALNDAQKSVDLKRELNGIESELISSLYLVQQEMIALDRREEAEAYGDEAAELTDKINDPHFILSNRVVELAKAFCSDEAKEILVEAKKLKNHEITAAVQTLQAMGDPSLSDTQRLSQLEVCLAEQAKNKLPDKASAPARQAMVRLLIKMEQVDRAEKWLREILEANPFDRTSRDLLIKLMLEHEEWGDAAIFLRKQIDFWGGLPGLMFVYGETLLRSGNLNEAVRVFTKVISLEDLADQVKKQAMELREEALLKGGTVSPARDDRRSDPTISREDFEQALSEFCMFVQADKRMTFWNKKEGKHEWIPRPEGHGQNLLHTYLKGKFGERIGIYEEISAGAGRVDIYVQLLGGLSIIVELKMCGSRYSSGYAASGEIQLLHYMENRNSYLGYLVVFDSRIRDFGSKLLQERQPDRFTVCEIICDVRPQIK